jgi:hypothetical protein
MGTAQTHVNSPERRDRLWLLDALAVALLTLLGAAGEALGFDKHLKASTTKRRVHSLFRQGCLHYQLMPTMQEARLRPRMEKFVQLMLEQPLYAITGSSKNEGNHEGDALMTMTLTSVRSGTVFCPLPVSRRHS